MIYAMILMIYK